MKVHAAYFPWGKKKYAIPLFCRPSGTSAAHQPWPQRAIDHWCKGEEAEMVWMCSCMNFCQRSRQLLCASSVFRVKVKRRHCGGTHTLREQNAACMLRLVHVVIFARLAGLLCLRGQHNLVSSVVSVYHGHSQRIWCEHMASPQRCPGRDFPLLTPGLPRHVLLYLCLLAAPSRSAVCTVLILFMLNKCFLQPLCCGDCFCWIKIEEVGMLV